MVPVPASASIAPIEPAITPITRPKLPPANSDNAAMISMTPMIIVIQPHVCRLETTYTEFCVKNFELLTAAIPQMTLRKPGDP